MSTKVRFLAAGLLASFLSAGSLLGAFAHGDDDGFKVKNMSMSRIGQLLHSGQINPQQAALMQAQMSGNPYYNQNANGFFSNQNVSGSWLNGDSRRLMHQQRVLQAQQQALVNGQYNNQYGANAYGQPYSNGLNPYVGYSQNPYGYNQGYQNNGYGYSPYSNGGGISSVVGRVLNSNSGLGGGYGLGSGSGLSGLGSMFSNF